MSHKSENEKIVIDGDEPKGSADAFAQARRATEPDEERRAKIQAAVKEVMSTHAKLLKKLAE